MPTSRTRQLLKFIRVFGAAAGLRLWLSLLGQTVTGATDLDLHVPGLAGPLHLRKRDLPIFWQIFVMREKDFDALPQATRVRDTYRQMLAEGVQPVVVDCGGHIGTSALWFASRFPKATVYSIEPDAANFALLQRNASSYRNIVPLHGGVWSQPCGLRITDPAAGSASFRVEAVDLRPSENGPETLRGYTVDEVFSTDPLNRLLLVKMDVEGAESEVFSGPAPWLGSTCAIVIELHDWLMPGQGTSRNFFKRLAEHPFDVVLRGENLLLFRMGTVSTGP